MTWNLLLCFCLGVTLAWKINFLVFVGVLFFVLSKKVSLKKALLYLFSIGLGFSLITFPFLFYDLENFSPLIVSNKIKATSAIPHMDKIVVLLVLVYSLTALTIKSNFTDNYLKKVIIALSIPVIGTTFLADSTLNRLNLLSYGMSYYGFFLLYLGKKLKKYNETLIIPLK